MVYISFLCSLNIQIGSSWSIFHTRAVLSSEHEANNELSGSHFIILTSSCNFIIIIIIYFKMFCYLLY